MTAFSYTEVVGDLFTADQSFVLAHCISADAVMGAGIAVHFKGASMGFSGNKAYIRNVLPHVGTAVFYQGRTWGVFNLVTKRYAIDKPTYQDLDYALADMARQICRGGFARLAMPLIGCGLDGLEWDKVKPLIIDRLGELPLEVVVYRLKGESTNGR